LIDLSIALVISLSNLILSHIINYFTGGHRRRAFDYADRQLLHFIAPHLFG